MYGIFGRGTRGILCVGFRMARYECITRLVMHHTKARNDFVITLGYEVRLVMLGGITRWLVMLGNVTRSLRGGS